MLKLNI